MNLSINVQSKYPKNQNTLYKQRFEYDKYLNKKTVGHQYATDIAMAYTKAEVMYTHGYEQIKNDNLLFNIPVYEE